MYYFNLFRQISSIFFVKPAARVHFEQKEVRRRTTKLAFFVVSQLRRRLKFDSWAMSINTQARVLLIFISKGIQAWSSCFVSRGGEIAEEFEGILGLKKCAKRERKMVERDKTSKIDCAITKQWNSNLNAEKWSKFYFQWNLLCHCK